MQRGTVWSSRWGLDSSGETGFTAPLSQSCFPRQVRSFPQIRFFFFFFASANLYLLTKGPRLQLWLDSFGNMPFVNQLMTSALAEKARLVAWGSLVSGGRGNSWKFLQGSKDKLATVPIPLYHFRGWGETWLLHFAKSEVVEASLVIHPDVGEEDREENKRVWGCIVIC